MKIAKTVNTAAEGELWARNLQPFAQDLLNSTSPAKIWANDRDDSKALVNIAGDEFEATIDELDEYLAQLGDFGEVYQGTPDGDHLINLEPIFDGHDPEPYPESEAIGILEEVIRGRVGGPIDLVEAPWGWTFRETADDGSIVETHYCWRRIRK